MVRIGIIREGKTPQDARVPLNPQQAAHLAAELDAEVRVQPSPHRCFSDDEYRRAGLTVTEDLGPCEVLLGVKEVPIEELHNGKTHFFFSHTIKAQPYNRTLLQTVLERKVRLVDWETLTNEMGQRVIAFGRWAGIVGAHNALWTWGQRSGAYSLPRAKDVVDYAALKTHYEGKRWPPFKIVVTGNGRVAKGAMEVLDHSGIRKVSPAEFRETPAFGEAVYTQLYGADLYAPADGSAYVREDFYAHPDRYQRRFESYLPTTDIFINAIYWDPAAPVFWTLEEMASPDFRIRAIADITCDIEGSVPSTTKASTIADPVFGWDLAAGREADSPYGENTATVMSIDNLPNELPRDASTAFGEQFLAEVWPALREGLEHPRILRATIALNGSLNAPYHYLEGFVRSA